MRLITLLVPLLVTSLLAPAQATGGGTVIDTPPRLAPAACQSASRIASAPEAAVVGCVDSGTARAARVALVRVGPGSLCISVAPEGESDMPTGCVNSLPEGGPVWRDRSAVLRGVQGIEPLPVRPSLDLPAESAAALAPVADDWMLFSALASRDIHRARLSYTPLDRERPESVDVDSVLVEGSAAKAAGAQKPFRIFAGAISPLVDTCRPMTLEAMAPGGPLRLPFRVEWGMPAPASAVCGGRYMKGLAERIRGVAESLMATARRELGNAAPGVVGRSGGGRPIRIRHYGESGLDEEVLVFGCIHGDECAARTVQPRFGGCPALGLDLHVVGNLNPDGLALGTRLNGRGVDLNRNFPVDWKPIGRRGSPQYSGPRPFSEPETRLAVRMIQRIEPEVTVWFHQHDGRAFVRAWGQSVPAARRFADLAGMPFRRLPWLAGTAPNWQNNTFPHTSSFVVELPDGEASPARLGRLGYAMTRLARETTNSGGE